MTMQNEKRIIGKKCWPEFFQAVLDGKKNFDLRSNDFEIEEGDMLVLREWDPEKKEYTGRELEKEVAYRAIFSMDNLEEMYGKQVIEERGFQIMSLR